MIQDNDRLRQGDFYFLYQGLQIKNGGLCSYTRANVGRID